MKGRRIIKKIFSVIFFLLFIAFISISSSKAEDINQDDSWKERKGIPILDDKIIPGFVLRDCHYNFETVIEMDGGWYVGGRTRLDNKPRNTYKIKKEREYWSTLSEEESSKIRAKLGEEKVVSWNILVGRYLLSSPNDAELFADAYKNQQGEEFSETTFSGKTLGQRCWTNKDSARVAEEKASFGYSHSNKIIFIRGCTVVFIDGYSVPIKNNPNPMPSEFIEKVARAIDDKLK